MICAIKNCLTIQTLILSILIFSSSVFAETLTDSETGLSVTLPSGWEFDEPMIELFYFVNQRDRRINGGVGFDTPRKDGGKTARSHAEKRIAEMKEFEERGNPISDIQSTTLAGLEAVSFTVTRHETKTLYIFALKEKQILLLLFAAPSDQFAAATGDFEFIRRSIHF